MTRASTQGRFPTARAAPFILADLFAQCEVEGVTVYREWKTVPDPRTRAQAYYDLKERLIRGKSVFVGDRLYADPNPSRL